MLADEHLRRLPTATSNGTSCPRSADVALRRLRPDHLEALYDAAAAPDRRQPRARHPRPCTRSTSSSAARSPTPLAADSSPATSPSSPTHPGCARSQRSNSTPGPPSELQAFLRAAAGHRLFPPSGSPRFTGMRRNELLGLSWDDIDFDKTPPSSVNRGLVAVGYELHETRGKTRNARRAHRPRPDHRRGPRRLASTGSTPSTPPSASTTTAGCSPTATANPSTPTPSRKRSNASPAAPACRSSASTTCATPTAPCSSRPACRSRSSANDSATPTRVHIDTYQHVLPGMQADAARTFEAPRRPRFYRRDDSPVEPGGSAGRRPPEHGRTPTEGQISDLTRASLVAGAGFEPATFGL